jgi:hypothetical protein
VEGLFVDVDRERLFSGGLTVLDRVLDLRLFSEVCLIPDLEQPEQL